VPITHAFVSAEADGSDPDLVNASDWNEVHAGPPWIVTLSGGASVTPPAGVTEIDGTRTVIDFTNVPEIHLVTHVTNAASANTMLLLQTSPDQSTWTARAEVEVDTVGLAVGYLGEVTLGEVYARLATEGGDNSNNLITGPVTLREGGEEAPAGGITDPTDIADLLLWLDADDIAQSDNTAVSAWADASGGSWSAAQASGTLQPTYQTNEINGHAVVRFDGSNDYLKITSFATGGGNTLTAYAVFKASTPGSEKVVLQHFDPWNSNTGGWMLTIKSSGKSGFGHKGNVGLSNADTTADTADGTTHIVRVLYDMTLSTNEVTAFVDGVSSTGTYANNNNNATAFGTSIDIAEIAIWSRALTTQENLDMVDYLQTKYGL
jgi:hypothetical protein